jgi:CubicO group peptidase (beta-lactamase class C family)
MTSICALQLVEQNKLNLDDPVYEKIPELKDFPVLKGFSTDDGSPIEAPHTQPITLRSLLVHTSGFSYESIHPLQMQWLQFHGREVGMAGTVLERYSAPMVFQPGSSWMYGPSLDFVGLLIERVTGQTLESYMRVNLWEKLGIKDMTFFISKNEGMKSRFAEMANRDAATGKISKHQGYVPWADETGLKETEGCMGGHGVFATLEEYIKVLHAVLTCDDDEKILRKETLELLFSPQLGPASKATMNGFLQSDFANNAMGGTPMDIEKDHGLGGLLLGGDTPSGMKAGTLIWGGLPNLTWVSGCDFLACQ